MLPLVVQRK
uniref:Uncharacterized protein n=1 Tax=Anguilla anguilla TaxID=7936 RepID=A0A0E9SEY2_ANGAN